MTKRKTHLLFSVSFKSGLGLHMDGMSRVAFRAAARPAFLDFTRSLSDPAVLPLSRSISKPFFIWFFLFSRFVFSWFVLAEESLSMSMSYLSVYSNNARPWCTLPVELSNKPGVSFSWLLKGLKNTR